MANKSILIVDDEEAVCWSLRRAFEREGFRVGVAASAEEAFEVAPRQRPDVIILDVRLPGMDGIAALNQLNQLTNSAPVIVITAHGNLSTAVRAVEAGAFDYIAKPFDLTTAIEAAHRALKRPSPKLGTDNQHETAESSEEIVGRGPAMQGVFKRIALVAPHDACVLITGESGTGKELVARAIHRHSMRRDKPFLPVHVAAMNPNIVESELFGHVKGAFTGAGHTRPGLLSLADGGTVFLDELADIPLSVQAKLLRVLERQEVLPVGGNTPQQINVRILSATHGDLPRAVSLGQFRHDLYFRLNVFAVHLPALRDRTEDIPLLAEHFLRRFDPRVLPLTPDIIRFLQARPWRGNVREFRNALEHAAIVARGGVLLPEHFPSAVAGPSADTLEERLVVLIREWVREQVDKHAGNEPADLHLKLLDAVEPALLDEVLKHLHGNRLVAARWLGLARATVRKLIRKHLAPDEPGDDEIS